MLMEYGVLADGFQEKLYFPWDVPEVVCLPQGFRRPAKPVAKPPPKGAAMSDAKPSGKVAAKSAACKPLSSMFSSSRSNILTRKSGTSSSFDSHPAQALAIVCVCVSVCVFVCVCVPNTSTDAFIAHHTTDSAAKFAA